MRSILSKVGAAVRSPYYVLTGKTGHKEGKQDMGIFKAIGIGLLGCRCLIMKNGV